MDPHKKPVPQNKSGIFKNCYMHILPVALGKKRMSLFQTQITNQGGICVSKLAATNCNLTHVILDDSVLMDSERCVRLLNTMNVDTNKMVKVVGTQWVSKCLKECAYVDTKEFELPVEKITNKVNTQSNSQTLYEEECINEAQGKGTMMNDVGDLTALTVQHSPPKKLKPAVSEVHLLIYQYPQQISIW